MARYKLKDNKVLELFTDDDPESPNNWLNEDIFLIHDHRQFNVQREGFEGQDIHDRLTATEEELEEEGHSNFDNYYIFPVSAYIHSGVSLSLGTGTGWDTSNSGYILVLKSSIKRGGDGALKIAESYAENLIKTWNIYLGGTVHGFRLYNIEYYTKVWDNKKMKDERGEDEGEIDSCYGYYVEDEEEMLALILEELNLELEKE